MIWDERYPGEEEGMDGIRNEIGGEETVGGPERES